MLDKTYKDKDSLLNDFQFGETGESYNDSVTQTADYQEEQAKIAREEEAAKINQLVKDEARKMYDTSVEYQAKQNTAANGERKKKRNTGVLARYWNKGVEGAESLIGAVYTDNEDLLRGLKVMEVKDGRFWDGSNKDAGVYDDKSAAELRQILEDTPDDPSAEQVFYVKRYYSGEKNADGSKIYYYKNGLAKDGVALRDQDLGNMAEVVYEKRFAGAADLEGRLNQIGFDEGVGVFEIGEKNHIGSGYTEVLSKNLLGIEGGTREEMDERYYKSLKEGRKKQAERAEISRNNRFMNFGTAGKTATKIGAGTAKLAYDALELVASLWHQVDGSTDEEIMKNAEEWEHAKTDSLKWYGLDPREMGEAAAEFTHKWKNADSTGDYVGAIFNNADTLVSEVGMSLPEIALWSVGVGEAKAGMKIAGELKALQEAKHAYKVASKARGGAETFVKADKALKTAQAALKGTKYEGLADASVSAIRFKRAANHLGANAGFYASVAMHTNEQIGERMKNNGGQEVGMGAVIGMYASNTLLLGIDKFAAMGILKDGASSASVNAIRELMSIVPKSEKRNLAVKLTGALATLGAAGAEEAVTEYIQTWGEIINKELGTDLKDVSDVFSSSKNNYEAMFAGVAGMHGGYAMSSIGAAVSIGNAVTTYNKNTTSSKIKTKEDFENSGYSSQEKLSSLMDHLDPASNHHVDIDVVAGIDEFLGQSEDTHKTFSASAVLLKIGSMLGESKTEEHAKSLLAASNVATKHLSKGEKHVSQRFISSIIMDSHLKRIKKKTESYSEAETSGSELGDDGSFTRNTPNKLYGQLGEELDSLHDTIMMLEENGYDTKSFRQTHKELSKVNEMKTIDLSGKKKTINSVIEDISTRGFRAADGTKVDGKHSLVEYEVYLPASYSDAMDDKESEKIQKDFERFVKSRVNMKNKAKKTTLVSTRMLENLRMISLLNRNIDQLQKDDNKTDALNRLINLRKNLQRANVNMFNEHVGVDTKNQTKVSKEQAFKLIADWKATTANMSPKAKANKLQELVTLMGKMNISFADYDVATEFHHLFASEAETIYQNGTEIPDMHAYDEKESKARASYNGIFLKYWDGKDMDTTSEADMKDALLPIYKETPDKDMRVDKTMEWLEDHKITFESFKMLDAAIAVDRTDESAGLRALTALAKKDDTENFNKVYNSLMSEEDVSDETKAKYKAKKKELYQNQVEDLLTEFRDNGELPQRIRKNAKIALEDLNIYTIKDLLGAFIEVGAQNDELKELGDSLKLFLTQDELNEVYGHMADVASGEVSYKVSSKLEAIDFDMIDNKDKKMILEKLREKAVRDIEKEKKRFAREAKKDFDTHDRVIDQNNTLTFIGNVKKIVLNFKNKINTILGNIQKKEAILSKIDEALADLDNTNLSDIMKDVEVSYEELGSILNGVGSDILERTNGLSTILTKSDALLSKVIEIHKMSPGLAHEFIKGLINEKSEENFGLEEMTTMLEALNGFNDISMSAYTTADETTISADGTISGKKRGKYEYFNIASLFLGSNETETELNETMKDILKFAMGAVIAEHDDASRTISKMSPQDIMDDFSYVNNVQDAQTLKRRALFGEVPTSSFEGNVSTAIRDYMGLRVKKGATITNKALFDSMLKTLVKTVIEGNSETMTLSKDESLGTSGVYFAKPTTKDEEYRNKVKVFAQLSMLIEDRARKTPSREPIVTKKGTLIHNKDYDMSENDLASINNQQSNKWHMDDSITKFFEVIGDEEVLEGTEIPIRSLEAFGWLDPHEEGINVEDVEHRLAVNMKVENEAKTLVEAYKTYGDDTIYLPFTVHGSKRTMITSALNPTESKMHREFVHKASYSVEVGHQPSDKRKITSIKAGNLTNGEAFEVGVAQGFDMDPDKNSIMGVYVPVRQLVNIYSATQEGMFDTGHDSELKTMLEEFVKGDDYRPSKEFYALGGVHAVKAAMELKALYEQKGNNDSKPFVSSLTFESDAITSGAANLLTQVGFSDSTEYIMGTSELFSKVGLFTEDSKKEWEAYTKEILFEKYSNKEEYPELEGITIDDIEFSMPALIEAGKYHAKKLDSRKVDPVKEKEHHAEQAKLKAEHKKQEALNKIEYDIEYEERDKLLHADYVKRAKENQYDLNRLTVQISSDNIQSGVKEQRLSKVKSVDRKALSKSRIADHYIGVGVPGSSTHQYAEDMTNALGFRNVNNTSEISEGDIVFVSINGGHGKDREKAQQETIELAKEALEQGAVLVFDSKVTKYNTGEKLLRESFGTGVVYASREIAESAEFKADKHEVMFARKSSATYLANETPEEQAKHKIEYEPKPFKYEPYVEELEPVTYANKDEAFQDNYTTIAQAIVRKTEEIYGNEAEIRSAYNKHIAGGGKNEGNAYDDYFALLFLKHKYGAEKPNAAKLRSVAKDPVMVFLYGASMNRIKANLSYNELFPEVVKALRNQSDDNGEFGDLLLEAFFPVNKTVKDKDGKSIKVNTLGSAGIRAMLEADINTPEEVVARHKERNKNSNGKIDVPVLDTEVKLSMFHKINEEGGIVQPTIEEWNSADVATRMSWMKSDFAAAGKTAESYRSGFDKTKKPYKKGYTLKQNEGKAFYVTVNKKKIWVQKDEFFYQELDKGEKEYPGRYLLSEKDQKAMEYQALLKSAKKQLQDSLSKKWTGLQDQLEGQGAKILGQGIEDQMNSTYAKLNDYRSAVKKINTLSFTMFKSILDDRLQNATYEDGTHKPFDKLTTEDVTKIIGGIREDGLGYDITLFGGQSTQDFNKKSSGSKRNDLMLAETIIAKAEVKKMVQQKIKENQAAIDKGDYSSFTEKASFKSFEANATSFATITIHHIDGELIRRALIDNDFTTIYDAVIMPVDGQSMLQPADDYNHAFIDVNAGDSILAHSVNKANRQAQYMEDNDISYSEIETEIVGGKKATFDKKEYTSEDIQNKTEKGISVVTHEWAGGSDRDVKLMSELRSKNNKLSGVKYDKIIKEVGNDGTVFVTAFTNGLPAVKMTGSINSDGNFEGEIAILELKNVDGKPELAYAEGGAKLNNVAIVESNGAIPITGMDGIDIMMYITDYNNSIIRPKGKDSILATRNKTRTDGQKTDLITYKDASSQEFDTSGVDTTLFKNYEKSEMFDTTGLDEIISEIHENRKRLFEGNDTLHVQHLALQGQTVLEKKMNFDLSKQNVSLNSAFYAIARKGNKAYAKRLALGIRSVLDNSDIDMAAELKQKLESILVSDDNGDLTIDMDVLNVTIQQEEESGAEENTLSDLDNATVQVPHRYKDGEMEAVPFKRVAKDFITVEQLNTLRGGAINKAGSFSEYGTLVEFVANKEGC